MIPCYYEINVTFQRRHLFATAPRSIQSKAEADRLLSLFAVKFPESEGFIVTCSARFEYGEDYAPETIREEFWPIQWAKESAA